MWTSNVIYCGLVNRVHHNNIPKCYLRHNNERRSLAHIIYHNVMQSQIYSWTLWLENTLFLSWCGSIVFPFCWLFSEWKRGIYLALLNQVLIWDLTNLMIPCHVYALWTNLEEVNAKPSTKKIWSPKFIGGKILENVSSNIDNQQSNKGG